MTPHQPADDDGRRPSVHEELRAALGGAAAQQTFDHAALVVGAKERAGRLRRRRAVGRVAAALVLVPAIAGAGWVLGQRVAGGPEETIDVTVATQTEMPTQAPPVATEEPAASAEADVRPTPPWQPTRPPEPASGTVETNPDLPNLVDIPDPRPTGLAVLDGFGAPQTASLYPRHVPLAVFTLAGEDGVEPHSAAQWSSFDGSNDLDQDQVTITVTAWDDSAAALAALRTGQGGLTAFWADPDGLPGVPDPVPWPGHDDPDHLLVLREGAAGQEGVALPVAGALVRQGDYLVGVTFTVSAADAGISTGEEAVDAAAEIAQKTAENLAALDPENGTDP